MDSDRVILMDGGQAHEFDHPHELLQNPTGYFSNMVRETGSELEKRLRKIAEDDYNKKYPSPQEEKSDKQKSKTDSQENYTISDDQKKTI